MNSTRSSTSTNRTINLSLFQIDYSVEYTKYDEPTPLIHLFGNTPSGDTHHVIVEGFQPYFYVPESEATGIKSQYETVTDLQSGFQTINHKDAVRVYTQTPKNIRNIRDDFEHYEADVHYTTRFLVDKGIFSGVRVPDRSDNSTFKVNESEVESLSCNITPQIHYLDIEVNDRNGFPNADEATEPIISLSTYDSEANEYIAWLLKPDENTDIQSALSDYEHIDSNATYSTRQFPSEDSLLATYLTYIQQTNPDILTGWNVDDFDMTYLVSRLNRLNEQSDYELHQERLSPINEVWENSWRGPNIKGRGIFDLLEAYKRMQQQEKESYKLDHIANIELGVGKTAYTGDLGNLWESNPEQLLRYNLRDVELCVALTKKEDLIAFWNQTREVMGCSLESAPYPGIAIDSYVLHKANGRYVLPSKSISLSDVDEFDGGQVFEAITDVRDWVGVLDIKSLYPMLMQSINASPETKVDPDTYSGETAQSPNGTHFRLDTTGLIPEMVDELLSEREKKKSQREQYDPGTDEYETFDRQQAAIKVAMNALFGTLGWDRFRLYDAEISSAVTAAGRELIEHTATIATEQGFPVIYGDTDSIHIEFPETPSLPDEIPRQLLTHHASLFDDAGTSLDQTAIDALNETYETLSRDEVERLIKNLCLLTSLETTINDSYDEFARDVLEIDTHRLAIESETIYRRFMQAGKQKRYAGSTIWKDYNFVDSIDITGFEYQRSNKAQITKSVQKEILTRIVTGQPLESIKSYLVNIVDQFQSGTVEMADIAIPEGIHKPLEDYKNPSAHQRGAQYANVLFGTNFGQGSKPKRIELQRVDPDFWEQVESEYDLTPSGSSQAASIYAEFKSDPDVICFENEEQIPPEFEPDWETMMEKTIRKPMARVLEAIDLSWEEIETEQQHSGLDDFL